jgi:hypothetical protein
MVTAERATGRIGTTARPGAPVVAAVVSGAAATILALWRLQPGMGFWDTAEFQMVLPVMGTAHPTGYPSYVLLGWVANLLLGPIPEAALRMNVLSALLLGVAAAFTTDLARRLTGSVLLGIAAALGLTLTPIAWDIGTHADPHALHLAFVAIILWLLVRWEHARAGNPADADGPTAPDRADRFLLAAAAVVGLSVGNHSLTLLLGPPIVLFVCLVEPGVWRRPRFVVANAIAFVVPTVLVRFEMVLRAGWLRAPFVYADPSTWSGFWYVTLGSQFHSWVTDPFGNGGQRVRELVDMTVGQFGILAGLILVAAIVTAFRQPRYAALTVTAMILTCFFNSVYPDGAIDRYYLGPALSAWTWLAILGATAVEVVLGPAIGLGGDAPWRSRWVGSLAAIAAAVALVLPSLRAFPARAAQVDRTHDRFAEGWTDAVLEAVEPNAVIVSWWSYSTPLWYAQVVDDRRPDVCVIDDRTRLDFGLGELSQVIDRYIATRPVYLVRNGDSELPALVGRYDLTPVVLPGVSNLLRATPTGSPLGAVARDQVAATGPHVPMPPALSPDGPALRAGCP